MLLTRVTALVLALYLVLGQRLTLQVSTGGRGVVSPLEILFILCAAALWLATSWRWQPFGRGGWLGAIAPLFLVLLLLPFFAVLLGGYELRAFYAWVAVLVPSGILVLGRAAGRYQVGLSGLAFLCIVLHGLYGAGQMLFRLGLLPAGFWGRAAQWDAASQGAFSDSYLLFGRSTGLFISPNLFGMWSVLATIFGWWFLKGRQRAAAVVLGIVGVVGSQSRTAGLVMVVLAVIAAAGVLASAKRIQRGISAALLATPVIAVGFSLGAFSRLVENELVARFSTGASVLTQGIQADRNLSERVNVYDRAFEFAATQYPFGTLGPPQVQFVSFIDNQYLSLFLQGSLPLVMLYALAICTPLALMRAGVPKALGLLVMTASVAVFSATLLPLDSPQAVGLMWLAGGVIAAQSTPPAGAAGRPKDDSETMRVLSD